MTHNNFLKSSLIGMYSIKGLILKGIDMWYVCDGSDILYVSKWNILLSEIDSNSIVMMDLLPNDINQTQHRLKKLAFFSF